MCVFLPIEYGFKHLHRSIVYLFEMEALPKGSSLKHCCNEKCTPQKKDMYDR